MILIDTNVLLDVVTDDRAWADWSQQQLNAAALRDRLAINPVVYAEFSSRFTRSWVLPPAASASRASATKKEVP